MAIKKYVPTEREVAMVEAKFLAGEKLKDVKDWFCDSGIPARCFSEIRDSLFKRLRTDPSELARLANGPLLNASSVVRYPSGKRPAAAKVYQSSILDTCDGRMNPIVDTKAKAEKPANLFKKTK